MSRKQVSNNLKFWLPVLRDEEYLVCVSDYDRNSTTFGKSGSVPNWKQGYRENGSLLLVFQAFT